MLKPHFGRYGSDNVWAESDPRIVVARRWLRKKLIFQERRLGLLGAAGERLLIEEDHLRFIRILYRSGIRLLRDAKLGLKRKG